MKTIIKCICGAHIPVDPAAMLRAIKSDARSEASRINGKKGGRPRKDKTK